MSNGSDRAVVYTDGACSSNSGVGGWAYLIMYDGGMIKSNGGGKEKTTGNAMELKALCEAMVACSNIGVENMLVYSDSAYVINYFDEMDKWYRNDWKKNNGKSIKNKSLWKRVHELVKRGMRVEFEKVKAHSGDIYNDTVDSLAKGAIKDVDSREDS